MNDRFPSILASCWTTAGDVGPMSEDQRSPFALEDRIAAAASAGYTGFGGPWGVEILSAEFRRLGLDAQVTRSYSSAVRALQRAMASGFDVGTDPPGRGM